MSDSASPSQQARLMLSAMRAASLGTLTDDGAPFLSLVTVAQTNPLDCAMLLSGLAVHTSNLKQDGRSSLLVLEAGCEDDNPLTRARLTLSGQAVCLDRSNDAAARAAFLECHPEAAMYADFGDFAIWRFTIESAHLVAGFGRIVTLRPDDLAT